MINKLKWIAAIAAVMIALGANAQRKSASRSNREESRSERSSDHYTSMRYDSIDSHTAKIVLYMDGDVYKLTLIDDKLSEGSVNGKAIPAQDFGKYEPIIQKVKRQIEQDRKQAVLDKEQAERDREQAERDMEQVKADQRQAEEDARQAREDMEQARREARQEQQEAEQEAREAKEEVERDRREAEEDRKQAEQDRVQAKRDEEQAGRDRAQAEIDRKQAEEDRRIMKALTADLIKEKVIANGAELFALQLTDQGLIVNDEKQSAELHRKLKDRYLKKPNTCICFSNRLRNGN